MDNENLESKVKKYESLSSVKAYLVDTSARILFYVPIVGVWEKFAAGMDNEEVLKSRSGAVLVNLFVGRLHGKVREAISYLTRTKLDCIDGRSGSPWPLCVLAATSVMQPYIKARI